MDDLSSRARAYIAAVLALGTAAAVVSTVGPPRSGAQVTLCVALCLLAGLAQLFEVQTPGSNSYVVTSLFQITGVLLLPSLPLTMLAVAPFALEQVRTPKRWYIPAFNAASHVLTMQAAAIAARAVLHAFGDHAYSLDHPGPAGLAALAACVVTVVLNHALTFGVLRLARGVRLGESGLFGAEGLLTDGCLLSLGVVVAFLWDAQPALTLFALVPIALIQRSLHVPALQQASRTDAKTGLYNTAYFREASEAELHRAERTAGPTSVLVADLDLLRNINNTYGHLAGDVVLAGIADVLRGEVRDDDVVARFGGEEFAILLAGNDAAHAADTAERIRARVAAQRFTVATAGEPIAVTVSIGVATCPMHGTTLDALLHRADLAVYRAKVDGRDRVRIADSADDLAAAPATTTAPSTPSFPVARLFGRPADAAAADLPGRVREATAAAEVPLPRDPAATERASDQPAARTRRATLPYVAFVAVSAVAAVTLLLVQTLPLVQSPEAILLFLCLAVGAELAGESVYGSSAISVSGVAVLGAVAAGRPVAAIVAAVVSAVVGAVAVRRTVEQAVFNAANLALCATLAWLIRDAAGAGVRPSDLLLLAAVMVGASAAYFLLDNGLVSLVVSRDEGRHWWRVFRDDLLWLLPHFAAFGVLGGLLGVSYRTYGLVGVALVLLPLALVRVAQRQYLARTRAQVGQLKDLAADLSASHEQLADSNTRLGQALAGLRDQHVSTARTLARAIDARDHTTGGHIERVCALGVELCAYVDPALAADPQVSFGFLLHDVGKIGVPDHVLLKPGPLDEAERAIMDRHPEIGAALLEEAGFAGVARDIALTHHERWDGNGYPRGLVGAQTPLASRLFAVVDALDAMTNDRPYRRGLDLDDAYATLRVGAGSQFDPAAVEALLSLDEAIVLRCLQLGRTRDLRAARTA